MSHIKTQREYAGFSIKELAGMINVPEKELSAWERGKAVPGLAELRDLAVLFRCAVEDLVGENPFATEMGVRTSGQYLAGGHWGHIGILLNGEKTSKWFPVTHTEAVKVQNLLNDPEGVDWAPVFCLNNRFIALNLSEVARIRLLDDAADPPEGDWEVEGWDANGASTEIYRGLLRWANRDLGFGDPDDDDDDQLLESPSFQGTIADIVAASGKDAEGVLSEYGLTRITLIRGDVQAIDPGEEDLLRLIDAYTDGDIPQIICFNDLGDGMSEFIPSKKVAMIEIPLHDVLRFHNEAFSIDDFAEAIEIISAAARRVQQNGGSEEG